MNHFSKSICADFINSLTPVKVPVCITHAQLLATDTPYRYGNDAVVHIRVEVKEAGSWLKGSDY